MPLTDEQWERAKEWLEEKGLLFAIEPTSRSLSTCPRDDTPVKSFTEFEIEREDGVYQLAEEDQILTCPTCAERFAEEELLSVEDDLIPLLKKQLQRFWEEKNVGDHFRQINTED